LPLRRGLLNHIACLVVAQIHLVFLFRVLFDVFDDLLLVLGLDRETVPWLQSTWYAIGRHRRRPYIVINQFFPR